LLPVISGGATPGPAGARTPDENGRALSGAPAGR